MHSIVTGPWPEPRITVFKLTTLDDYLLFIKSLWSLATDQTTVRKPFSINIHYFNAPENNQSSIFIDHEQFKYFIAHFKQLNITFNLTFYHPILSVDFIKNFSRYFDTTKPASTLPTPDIKLVVQGANKIFIKKELENYLTPLAEISPIHVELLSILSDIRCNKHNEFIIDYDKLCAVNLIQPYD